MLDNDTIQLGRVNKLLDILYKMENLCARNYAHDILNSKKI